MLFFLALWAAYLAWVEIGARLGGDMGVAPILVHPAQRW
jgi:hypothetical protein